MIVNDLERSLIHILGTLGKLNSSGLKSDQLAPKKEKKKSKTKTTNIHTFPLTKWESMAVKKEREKENKEMQSKVAPETVTVVISIMLKVQKEPVRPPTIGRQTVWEIANNPGS